MRKGKWNYTEDIQYTVVLVKIEPVVQPKMHWQNAFVGEERQAVLVNRNGSTFYMDNQDGSGLLKIAAGGGPDSFHASIDTDNFIRELPENEWQQFDTTLHEKYKQQVNTWQEKAYPEDYARVKILQASIIGLRKGTHVVGKNGQIVPKD